MRPTATYQQTTLKSIQVLIVSLRSSPCSVFLIFDGTILVAVVQTAKTRPDDRSIKFDLLPSCGALVICFCRPQYLRFPWSLQTGAVVKIAMLTRLVLNSGQELSLDRW